MSHPDQQMIDQLNHSTGTRIDLCVNGQEALSSLAEMDRWVGMNTAAFRAAGVEFGHLVAVRRAIIHARKGVHLILQKLIEQSPTGVVRLNDHGELVPRKLVG